MTTVNLDDAILERFAPRSEERAITSESFWGPFSGGFVSSNLTGVYVNEQIALTFSAVFSAIHRISTDVAGLRLNVFRSARGRTQPAFDHPAYQLLCGSPDGETTAPRWRAALVGHALGWGNGYAEIVRDGRGEPTALHLLDPASTRPEREADGTLYYSVTCHSDRRIPTPTRKLRPDQIFHLAGFGFDGLVGYSPLRLNKQAVALGLAAESFGATFFGNGTQPFGVLVTDKRLSPEAQKALAAQWDELHQGTSRKHGTAVLQDGMRWEKLSIPPEDAQFLATRQFQVLEVARIFNIPPNKLGDYSQSHLANIEHSNMDYVQNTLTYWAESFEAEADRKLLTPAQRRQGYYFEHDFASILRGNSQARAQFYKEMVYIGAMTPNMVADREGFDTFEGGDVHLIPVNMTTIEKLTEPPASPSVEGPEPEASPDLNEETDEQTPTD